jgi:hypothetical protein
MVIGLGLPVLPWWDAGLQQVSHVSLTDRGAWVVQELPPSVVASTLAPMFKLAPAAQQSDVVEHERLWREKVPAGRTWVVQDLPPSVVAIIAPPVGPVPAAQQSNVLTHEIASSA